MTRAIGCWVVLVALAAWDGCASDDVCDGPTVKSGCVETLLTPLITVDDAAQPVAGYACRADNVDSLVRIRACISPRNNSCIVADAGESFCAVVDIPAAALSSFPPDTSVSLDGTTAFTFSSPFEYKVKPENVVYTPAGVTPVTRVWMESECFCTPIPPLTGSQQVKGALTITDVSDQRVGGRLELSVAGHVSPVNHRVRHIEIAALFEVTRSGVAR